MNIEQEGENVKVEITGVSEEVAERLEQICAASGALRPGDVLEDAKHPASPLNRYFQWDDGLAAAAYRMEQARTLIRRVRIRRVETLPEGPKRVTVARRYIAESDAKDNGAPDNFLPLDAVAGNPVYADHLREALRRDLERIRSKYDDLNLILDVAAEVFSSTDEVEIAV